MSKRNFTKSFLVICSLILISATFTFTQTPSKKKNSRPTANGEEKTKKNTAEAEKPVYFYEFSRPEMPVSAIKIEHDENGKGTISFLKKGFDEPITDPFELSDATLEKLKTHWQALNFLDSDEDYQFEKDYSHLGTIKITMEKDGRKRTAEFNWTQQKDAKALMNEYRKIANQYIWIFDINVSRENQPLESPRMMNNLDNLIRRNEISDASQMVPFLKGLSEDERIPLISRNHASRLVEKIEKQIKKQEKQIEKQKDEN